ncbi:MAG: glycosyltransferase [Anaerolineae bacterium]|nr:glycosyltransferase [Anaerolineae bacterium]
MKILMISEQLPSRIGGSIRQFSLIRELSQRHEFSVVCYAYPAQMCDLDTVKQFVHRIEVIQLQVPLVPAQQNRSHLYWRINGWRHALLDPYPMRGRYPLASQMRRKINALINEEQFDIVQVHQAYLAKFLPHTGAATILDMADILSEHERLVMLTKTKTTHRFAAWLEWKKMQTLERKAVRQFDMCVAISQEDKEKFLKLISHAHVAVVPNGVDLDYFQPQSASPKKGNLVFVGSMQYEPNADAVLYFCKEILPLIKQHRPDVHFHVVGWGPPPEIIALNNDPNITVTGFVDDVRPYVADSMVAVVPLRFGSGIRNKILEAWATARPVVSTTLGAEGLAVQHGENILLADEPNQFAQSVLSLLDDQQQRIRLAQAGRRSVESKYAWSEISQQYNAIYEAILSGRS